jgi:uncharacterized protein (TIGR03000 family)
VSYGHYGGYGGFNNYRGGGRYYSGYRNYGWPYAYRSYRNYYRPYAFGLGFYGYPFGYASYGYPYGYAYPNYYYSYPSDYYLGDGGVYYGDTDYSNVVPPQQYAVSRPVSDIARLEVRLPDPQATIWVQGQEMTSSGTVRQFKSPQLEPSQQFVYHVKAEWNANGKPVTDERQVKVQANSFALVDFTKPVEVAPTPQAPAIPDLPPPARQ